MRLPIIPVMLLLLSVACGKQEGDRCYTREEALAACQAEEISKSGVDLPTAKLLCKTETPYEGCYDIK
jgi:hypothetical protein